MSFGTASKIAWRELKAAPAKFIFVVLAVAIGVGALSGVKGFSAAFKSMLLGNARQLLAADLAAQIRSIPTEEELQQVRHFAGSSTNFQLVTETVSMAGSDRMRVPLMVSLKAVDPQKYPFYGTLGLEPQQSLQQLLSDEKVIVSPELLVRLKTKVGGSLRLGGKPFEIAGIVTTEPDRLAGGFGPGMRVFLTQGGLERSGLVQPGSRAAQRFLFKLPANADLDQLKDELKKTFPNARVSDFREGDAAVNRGIERATTFLSLISLVALIVGALGVAMAMYSHLQQKMDTIAVMKAIGARSQQIMQIYLIQTLWLGLAGGVIGIIIGALVQRSFPILIQRFFSLLPSVQWDWSFSLQGLSLGVLATLLFTVPPLLSIRSIRPSLVFRREMEDAKTTVHGRWARNRASLLSGLMILAGFGLVAVWLSNSWKMGGYFLAGLVTGIVLLGIMAALLLRLLRKAVQTWRYRLPSVFRHGLANLYRPGNQAQPVLVALGIGVMFTLATHLLQQTILREIQFESPGVAGNVFLWDIRGNERDAVEKLVESQRGVEGKLNLVGYFVARMLQKNGTPVENLALSQEKKYYLQTSRITTNSEPPKDLAVQQGRWWTQGTTDLQFAVSEGEAKFYELNVGDRLQFQAAGKVLEGPVVAVFRRNGRNAMRQDIVAPETAFANVPLIYFGSAKIQSSRIAHVEEAVFDRYPTITMLNLADTLTRVQEAVDQITVVIRFLALFAIAAGVVILSASVAGSRYRRIREVAILKTLGATRRRITAIFSIEFSVLGCVAGIVGAILANLFTKLISQNFLNTSFHFDWVSLIAVAIGTAILTNIAGWLASMRILGQRPLEVLRGE